MTIDINKDGIEYINIWSKGSTSLGQNLSNFHSSDITIEGITYKSIEQYWQSLKALRVEDMEIHEQVMQATTGAQCKKLGSYLNKHYIEILQPYCTSDEFKNLIKTAVNQKIQQNQKLKMDLLHSYLPFEHFYLMGNKLYNEKEKYSWLIKHIEEIRHSLQRQYLDKLLDSVGHRVFHVDQKVQDAKYLGRGKNSDFGNPFTHLPNIPNTIQVETVEKAIIAFRLHLLERIRTKPTLTYKQLKPLQGKTGQCHCNRGKKSVAEGGQYCHSLIVLTAADNVDILFVHK